MVDTDWGLIMGLIVTACLGLILLILNILNDFYYCEKYKQQAKLNYFLIKHYNKYSDKELNIILNKFYTYLDKESKQQQKEFEKKIKQDFKENIKNDIKYII